MSVLLVRHGATAWSSAGRHTGTTDVPVDADGERQAEALRPLLAPLVQRPGGTPVLSSPLVRAVRTAELAGLVPYTLDPDLREWDYGEYEGLTTAEIRERVPGWTVFTHPCPGGETAAEVAARCDRVLARVDSLRADQVVLVAHGHLLRSLAARWLRRPVGDGALLELGTAAVSVLGEEHGGRTLRHWNLANPSTQEPLW